MTLAPMTQLRPMRMYGGIVARLPTMVMPQLTMSGRSWFGDQSSP